MAAAARKVVNRSAAPAPPQAPVVVRSPPALLQTAGLKVSSPQDAAEKEAEQTARKVMRMADPAADRKEPEKKERQSPQLARFAAAIVQRRTPSIARKADGQPDVSANVAAEIAASQAAGETLPPSVRRFMEPRFGADFGGVRVHRDARAARLNRRVGALAFTVGNQIFFGAGRFQPDSEDGRELIAHELTHTVQQGAVAQAPPAAGAAPPGQAPVATTPRAPVEARVSRQVQRLGVSDALDYFAEQAYNIPGFRMFTIVLGINPVNMSSVDRSPANIMRAAVEFLPGGHLITQALDNHGVFDRVASWVAQQIASLGMVGSAIRRAIDRFLDSLSWKDIFRLGDVWNRAKSILTAPITQLINFAKGLVGGIIDFIKNAILMPIAGLAQNTRGWDLLCAVLGRNPITGDPVPRTADTLIGGFMKLIGQDEVWGNIKRANAIARCWAWFQGAMAALMGFVQQIPTLFINAFKSLEIADLILLPRAFAKVAGVFGNFIGGFMAWAGGAVWNLLEIVFSAVSPGAWSYIQRTGAALRSILKNPIPFVGNLVRAAKSGFQAFAGNFLKHLKAGLIEWLTGALPGVYIPKSFALGEFVKFLFSVLGLTWQNLRGKLVKVVGEPAVKAMETGFDIVVTLVTKGPAAAWEQIKAQLTSLKDTVIGGIISMVVEMIVTKAIPKVVAMFIPGAGFISAIISIYDTVMVFVSKLARIAQVVSAFVNSIVQIAAGQIAAAAKRVEGVLAGLLSLAISFLAGFAGLGKVADKVMGVINKIRAPIDKAMDALVKWVVGMAKKLFAKAFGKDKADDRTPAQKQADLTKALRESEALQRRPNITEAEIRKGLPAIKTRYKMTALDLVVDSKDKLRQRVHVRGKINPEGDGTATDVNLAEDGQCNIKISRPSFNKSLKDRFREEYPGSHVGTRLAANVDRRHIVSSDEMAKHYETILNPMTWSKARERLTSKGEAGIPEPAKNADIQTSAKGRHRRFFNDLENLWPGGASENRSLGAARDPPPWMNEAAADAHAQKMMAKYGLA